MSTKSENWEKWVQFFLTRKDRGLPELESAEHYAAIPASLAKSLAIFQLGESGGGTVVEQVRRSSLKGADDDYAEAMAMFVDEEHRHAELLAICVRNLHGELIRTNWTAKLFVFARRLIGLRLKVIVLLVAEVVGISYYHLLATRLPGTRLQTLLANIVNDERAHLYFHCRFLRLHVKGAARRFLFILIWRITIFAAALVVLLDHRKALRDLDISVRSLWRRWMSYSRLAERLVTGKDEARIAELLFCQSRRRGPILAAA